MNPNIAIEDIMTTKLVTVLSDAGLAEVRKVFEAHAFHHLPIVELGGELVGIISREDFYKVAYVLARSAAGADTQYLAAADIMTKYPLQLSPDDSIGLAADIFLANKFHALPIVEDGQLVGIVTSHDLLAYCFSSPIGGEEPLEELDEA